MARSALITRTKQPRPTLTGLDVNVGNEVTGSDIRFEFSVANTVQRYPRTELRRVLYRQQNGYRTTMFRTNAMTFGSFVGNRLYEGTHFYPHPTNSPSGETHHHEISIDGKDTPTSDQKNGLDDNGNSTLGENNRWYIQATRLRLVSGDLKVEYFYDLAAGIDRVVSYTIIAANIPADPGNMQHVFLSSPWTGDGNSNSETHFGLFRANQIYSDALSDANMLAAAACNYDDEVLSLGLGNLWHLCMNPTPSDLTDKSGNGRHPTWANALRPALFTGSP